MEAGDLAQKRLRILLQFGMYMAVALFAVGIIYDMAAEQSDIAETLSLPELMSAISTIDPDGVLAIGIFFVIATPIAKLIISAASFAGRDRLLAASSLLVLIVIAIGFIVRTIA